MKVQATHPSSTEAIVTIIPSEAEIDAIKEHVLAHFQDSVKVPGFRPGKIPSNILEKHVNATSLQSQFLQEAIEQLFSQALQSQNLRPVGQPNITVKKFVPYSVLEFEAAFATLGAIKLGDYKKIKKTKPKVTIVAKDIEEVIASLRTRAAEKVDVDRAAGQGDQAWIDFKGVDTKGAPVQGAEGADYPLIIGSNAFIPGFEENLIGMKANTEKTFTLAFPKDYDVKALASKKVTFKVNVTKVQELKEPKVDDDFATKIGPFKSLAELKSDIKKQLIIERQREADRVYENELIKQISDKSVVDIPKPLVDDQIERMEQEERQNLTYRGQTWEEHLKDEGVNEDQHKEQKRPQAEERIKASLVLAEIAEQEQLKVTEDELDVRMQLLRDQYKDPQMQTELDKPEARRDIAGRILTEKTLEKLVAISTK
ncbi:MAG: trigger factor [Patescibacteria group bacterium]